MPNNNNVCRFCLRLVRDTNVELINEVTQKILGVLLIKLNLDVSKHPTICKMCSGLLDEIYMFKSRCLHSEDIVSAHFESNLKVNLRDILIELENKSSVHIAEDEMVCRLCIKIPSNDKYITLNKTDHKVSSCSDMMQIQLPEIDLSITKEPIICEECFTLLKSYLSFATSCTNVEQRIKMYCEHQGCDVKEQVDLHCVLEFIENKALDCENGFNEDLVIKHEDSSVDVKAEKVAAEKDNLSGEHFTHGSRAEFYIKEEEVDIKLEDDQISSDQLTYSSHAKYNLLGRKRSKHPPSPKVMLQCNQCNFSTKTIRSLHMHKKTHDPTQRKFKCVQCEYTTHIPASLRDHLVIHMGPGETVLYYCATCDFKSKHKRSLRDHRKRCSKKKDATDSSVTFQCNQCNFCTKTIRSLCMHKKTHDPTQRKFKCEQCEYTTHLPASLRDHVVIHMRPGETVLYYCATCDFKSKHKRSLRDHLKRCSKEDAMDSSVTFQCNQCDFHTKYRDSLKRHDPAEHKLMCKQCDYSTYRRSNLSVHLLRHTELGQTEVYYCATCDFKSKYKSSLRNHIKTCLKKKGTGSRVLLQCDQCDFRTKNRSSLYYHKKLHDPTEAKLKCEQCEYSTHLRFILNRHLMTHMVLGETGVYYCATCKFKSKYKWSLISHVKRCLKKKEKDDTDSRVTLQCNQCDFHTKSKSFMYKHKKTHNPDKHKFVCQQCEYWSYYSTSLNQHLVTHMDMAEAVAYSCATCDFQTKYKSSLRYHVKRCLKKNQCDFRPKSKTSLY